MKVTADPPLRPRRPRSPARLPCCPLPGASGIASAAEVALRGQVGSLQGWRLSLPLAAPPWVPGPGPAVPARCWAGSGVSRSRPGLAAWAVGAHIPGGGLLTCYSFAGLSHQAPGTWSGSGGSWGCPCPCPHSWGIAPHARLPTSPHPLWKLSLSSYLPVSPSLLGTPAPSSRPSLTISRPNRGQQEPGRALSRQGMGVQTGGGARHCSLGLGAPEALGETQVQDTQLQGPRVLGPWKWP